MDKIVNLMEYLVIEQFEKIKYDLDICQCDICKMDIIAKALNDLPSKYYVSEEGKEQSRLNLLRQRFDIDITTAIEKAAILVQQNPNH